MNARVRQLLEGKPLNDCCGAQRLPNGNTVITREKKVVWTYTDDRPSGIHEFQILDTNGVPLPGRPLR